MLSSIGIIVLLLMPSSPRGRVSTMVERIGACAQGEGVWVGEGVAVGQAVCGPGLRVPCASTEELCEVYEFSFYFSSTPKHAN